MCLAPHPPAITVSLPPEGRENPLWAVDFWSLTKLASCGLLSELCVWPRALIIYPTSLWWSPQLSVHLPIFDTDRHVVSTKWIGPGLLLWQEASSSKGTACGLMDNLLMKEALSLRTQQRVMVFCELNSFQSNVEHQCPARGASSTLQLLLNNSSLFIQRLVLSLCYEQEVR